MSTPSQPPRRIFVSHSTKDNDFGMRIVDDLRRVLGDDDAVWYDAHGGLQGGDSWWRIIMREIKARPIFIVILSPDANESRWVNAEIDLAWRQMLSPSGKQIIPLLYRACDVRDDIDTLQNSRFTPPTPYTQAFNMLLLALGLSSHTQTKTPTHSAQPVRAPQKTQDQSQQEDLEQKLQTLREKVLPIDADPSQQEAIDQWLQKVKEALQEHAKDPSRKDQLLDEGVELYNKQRYSEAIAKYNEALALDSTFARAYYNRGSAYYMLNKYQEAITDYDKTLTFDPDHTDAKKWRAAAVHQLKK